MKDKVNQLFKDKLFLVMMVIGLLTAVAAVGVLTVGSTDENGQSPYLEVPGGELMAKEKLFLVMMVIGLLTAVAAVGVLTVSNTDEKGQSPYLEVPGGEIIAQDSVPETAQKEEKAEEKISEIEASKVPQENYAQKEEKNPNTKDDLAAEAGAGKQAAKALVLNFSDTSVLTWPVRGNVILDYSMDQTIYFPTLDQFKCNPGIVIQAEVSDPVAAPANAKVLEVGSNEEIGNFVVLDLGNEYTATCGQLKEISAVPGEYLEAGQILGYVAEPTKYYSVEGVNVFFELKHQEKTLDPLDQME